MSAQVIPKNRVVYVETEIHIIKCASCQIDFGIGADFMRRRREDHQGFYCPNGHSNVYNGPSNAEQRAKHAEQELAAARSLAARESERRRLAEGQRAAARGEVTRLRKRISNGVCPCCDRHFSNLDDHMACEHPDYRFEDGSEPGALTVADLSPNQVWTLQTIGRHLDNGEDGAPSVYLHKATVRALVKRDVLRELGDGEVVVPTTLGLHLIAEAGSAQ